MVTDIWNGLAQPGPIIGGVCIGLLLLTQRFSTVFLVFAAFLAWFWIISTTKFEVEVRHGAYACQADKDGCFGTYHPALNDPQTISSDQVYQAAGELGAAIIWIFAVWTIGGRLNLLKTRQPCE
jgi:hypothetical protein